MLQLAGLREPRPQISEFAPRLEQIRINPSKIGALIGPKGANIKKIQEEFKVTVEVVDDTGLVHVSGTRLEGVKAAVERIKGMTVEPEVGRVYSGTIKSVKEFGAFVEIFPGVEGLCHVSELGDGYVKRVSDVVKVGDAIKVKVINIDETGRVKLSAKGLNSLTQARPA
jgi:polyribonucleotide nucleotidyltransferase